MAILTFMSDFGHSDHYVAAVKARILSINPGIQIVDVSHDIAPHDLAHASFILGSVFRDFPLSTVHLVCLSALGKHPQPAIAMRMEDHYFVGQDSGLFSLIGKGSPDIAVDLDLDVSATFSERDVLAPVAAKLASGDNLHEMGRPYADHHRLTGRIIKANKQQIVGHVVRVDGYGNLITNIPRTDFENITELNANKGFSIRVGREKYNGINTSFGDVEGGEVYLLFNSLGVLQVGINGGNASQLLGLGLDTPIIIEFLTD